MRNTRSSVGGVASRVRDAMAERGITGVELAKRLGVTQPYMSRRLTGAVEFRASELESVARALGVPLTRLLPEDGEAAA